MKKKFLLVFNSSFFKNKLFSLVLNYLKVNKNDFDYFIQEYNKTYPGEIDRFSSAHNNGYKHIDEAITLSSYFQLPSSNSIIDVGGATGQVALMFAKKYPASKIYSFEPIPSTYKMLVKNTGGSVSIIPINKGLGSIPGNAEIHVTQRFTSSSLLAVEKNIENPYFTENLKETGTESIIVSTLDKEIPLSEKINILKIDVQGYELEVLKGGMETLTRTAIVLVEMQNHDLYKGAPKYYDIDAFLVKVGFELYDIIPSISQDKKLYEWDAIFVNKKSLK
jgi:FkbM family methyltransferase